MILTMNVIDLSILVLFVLIPLKLLPLTLVVVKDYLLIVDLLKTNMVSCLV